MALNKIKVNDTTTVNTGVVYDISKATSQSYDSLSAALGTDGNNVPPEVREGGMTVRFVHTGENKYVQYFLTKDEWSASKSDWEKMNLKEEVSQLGQYTEDTIIYPKFNTLLGKTNLILTSSDIEQGGYVYGQKTTRSNRLRCKFLIPVYDDVRLSITYNSLQLYAAIIEDIMANSYVWYKSFESGAIELTIQHTGYLVLIFRNPDDSDIQVSAYDAEVVIQGNTSLIDSISYLNAEVEVLKRYFPQVHSDFVIGGWGANGYLPRTDRARIERVHVLNQLYVFGYNYLKFRAAAFFYTYDSVTQTYTYQTLDQQEANDYTKSGRIFTLPSSLAGRTDVYIGVAIIKRDGTDITSQELDNIKDSVVVDYNLPKIVSGPNRLAYQFGGSGNDWCFVRTPANYEAKREKPYPFVICNHGNGRTMNGRGDMMNWTKRTMYVPTNDPDYIANPTQYNGTEDRTLWYSNPTIEALLAAGFIVCGCENYADTLYGNENCRKACADFFYHIQEYYNVEGRCCMIGASNGAQTSINAAYLLGDKVKAMILQYPLTCLVNQYFSHTEHQAGILSAYGLSGSPTESELINATRTHDVLHTNMAGTIKVGYFPPTKFYYSESDAVVNYQENTIAMYDMLDASLKICEKVQCSGGHGDYTHFAPADYVAFFDKY